MLDKNLHPFLISKISSFEKHLRRKSSLSKVKQKGYVNLLKLLRKVIDEVQKGTAAEGIQKDLNRLINKTKPLTGKVWLRQKLKAQKDDEIDSI